MAASLIRFFLLAYGISWAVWAPLWLPALGITGLPVLPCHHAFGAWGPMAAAFICTALEEGSAGMRGLLRRMMGWRPVAYLLIALLAPFALLLIGMAVSGAWDVAGALSSPAFPEMPFAAFFGYNLLFFGFGEETGWRGFALPRLQQRMNAAWASVLLTGYWALWHWPLFLYQPGFAGMGIGSAAGWCLSLLTGSVLLTWLSNSTRGSILVAAVFHATVDVAFTNSAATPKVVAVMGLLIMLWGAAVVIIAKPKRLACGEQPPAE